MQLKTKSYFRHFQTVVDEDHDHDQVKDSDPDFEQDSDSLTNIMIMILTKMRIECVFRTPPQNFPRHPILSAITVKFP